LARDLELVKSRVEGLETGPGMPVSRSDLETVIKEVKKLNSQIEALNIRQNSLASELKQLKSGEMNFQQSTAFIDSINYSILEDIQYLKNKISELNETLKSLPAAGSAAAKVHPGRRTPEAFKEEYIKSLGYFQNKKYDKAIEKFSDLLRTNPDHELADNAQYWLAEAYYMKGDYQRALVEFEKVFTFTQKGKYDDAQLKLGYCYLKLGQKDKAKEEFERLISHYPYSEYYQKAQEMLTQLR
ncbi:TPA: tol-pal system protein YbgF, partial [Candidatus Marinimicrobia bacterium]|nr:tol-pal system protein YbgF [Candidatus Neomarinimicrobiota bacterium]